MFDWIPAGRDGARSTAPTHRRAPGRPRPRRRNRLVIVAALALVLPVPAVAEECAEAYGDCLWNAMVWDMVIPGVGDRMEMECFADYAACVIERFN